MPNREVVVISATVKGTTAHGMKTEVTLNLSVVRATVYDAAPGLWRTAAFRGAKKAASDAGWRGAWITLQLSRETREWHD